jgi:ABC-type multidrug transport system ATPase subunit
MSLTFGGKKSLIIGRDGSNDIKLDGLQISSRHARLVDLGSSVVVEDLNSTNGVYVNGSRVSRAAITPVDSVQIGSFLLKVDANRNIGVFDSRSKTRIDAIGITKDVGSAFGGSKIRLLDSISLSIQPNEFVGILGPSGSGKSTLIEAMNGMRPATAGNVLVNNLDLYRHIDSLKQAIGYVPQDDIIHRELSVYRTLYYVAKLRLSSDVSSAEINQTINEVLDVTGLADRRDVAVNRLSGGQRKRVSIAVELITKPSIIFLDEPTSGLDPGVEEKIMRLFRQIAESGRTVILTTHAMENVRLFDKIIVLMRGRLVFFGKPEDALTHLGAANFKELFDKLEAPVDVGIKKHGESARQQITDKTAEEWRQKFLRTPLYKQNVDDPLRQLGTQMPSGGAKRRRLGIIGSVRQWLVLSIRYLGVLFKDKLNLFILLVQAPVIAILTFFVMGQNLPRDLVYFVLALVAIWFGTSVSAREIIREHAIYRRERMVNLGILPYLGSKLFVLGIIVGIQCFLLFIPLKLLDLAGLMPMPGDFLGVPQFWAMLLTAAVGIAMGLLVSALVKTSEMATSIVPLILIPQILFSGVFGVPTGVNKVASMLVPAAWSFDTMKRYSTLDTLEPEGAKPNGATQGRGLYKYIETENDRIIAKARKDTDDYQKSSQDKLKKFQDDLRAGQNPPSPRFDEPPAIPPAVKIPKDMSTYITFLHPWMNEIVNQIVLMIMFGMLVIATLIVLRMRDLH